MISLLKKLINNKNIDGYIVPKNDEFFSEYAAKDRLKIISDFTGSAGFAIILKNKNYIFFDGRYSIQAEKECGKNFSVCCVPKKYPYQCLKAEGHNPQMHQPNRKDTKHSNKEH